MADFSSLIQGDYGLRQQSKLPVMNAVGGGGSVFTNPNRAEGVHEVDLSFKNGTSSLGKTLDESISGSGVSFDDVFGGPPKYATSLFASQAAAVEVSLRAPTRVSSFRGASLPVFELPVFGEDDPNGIGQKRVAYEDNFNDRSIFGGLPSMNLSSGSLMGSIRSKTSSPTLSRRHSPAHPGDSMFYSPQDDEAFVTSSVRPLKARLAAGKSTRFPSFSSLEDNKGKPGDSQRTVSKADPVILSVPSSPPRAGHWDYLRNLVRTRKGNTVRPVRNEIEADLDDVYGGFPQTSSLRTSHSFLAIQQVPSRDDKSNSKTGRMEPIEKPSLKGRKPESKFQGSSFTNDGTVISALFTPASSIDEPGLHDDFIELRMDRHLEPTASEKEKAGDWTMGSPKKQATVTASHKLDTPLRFKSWKDWVCEIPQNYQSADAPSPFVPAATPEEVRESVDEDSLCGFIDEWVKSVSDLLPEQEDKNSSEVLLLEKKVQAQESVKDTIDDKKLQGLLETGWKINEEKAGEKTLPKSMQETENVNEDISIGLHWKELRKQTSRQRNVSWSKDSQGRGEGTEMVTERGDFSNHVSQKTPIESKDMLRTERSVQQAPVISEDFSVERLEASKSDMVARRESDKAEDSVKEQVNAVTAGMSTYGSVTGTKPVSVAVPRVTSIERCAMGVIEVEKTKESLTEQQIASHPERVPSGRNSPTSCASSNLTDQLVEAADFQIKRWATGKEGNIRALLSNLQHVLWQGCGWQPIPLTDLIEGSAVKKAYRKATLFVHPDKMQQKGATIEQKYVAERVFDILQEAWKTFSYQDFL